MSLPAEGSALGFAVMTVNWRRQEAVRRIKERVSGKDLYWSWKSSISGVPRAARRRGVYSNRRLTYQMFRGASIKT